MDWPQFLAIAWLVLGCMLLGVCALRVARRRAPGALAFSLFLSAIAYWSLIYAGELLVPSLAAKYLFSMLEYPGIVVIPVAWLHFAWAYTGQPPLRPRVRRALLVMPALTLLIAFSNPLHGLLWRSFELREVGGLSVFFAQYGPWFWVNTCFVYALLLLGFGQLLYTFLRQRATYRWQALGLVAAALAPWLGNLLYISKASPLAGIDLTLFGFIATGLICYLTITRHRLLDLAPIAHRQVFNSLRDPLLVLDAEQRVVEYNHAALALLERDGEGLLGQVAPEALAGLSLPPSALEAGAARASFERSVGGVERTFELEVVPLGGSGGGGRLLQFRDITEQQAVAREAIEASRLKSAFLANMSHEIRTPITGVIGMLDLLLMTELDHEQRDYTRIARSSGAALMELLGEILDFSKIEAGMLTIHPAPFDLRELLVSVQRLFAQPAAHKSLRLEVALDEALPPRVLGDAGRLRQVLTNLVGNAIKFTERGVVLVRVRAEGELLRFEVADSGIGIAPEEQARLFEPFVQADTSLGRVHGGAGLGLAISRQLVEAMGGELGVASALGEGATFWFRLRLPAVVEPGPAEQAGPPAHGPHPLAGSRRLLVVEDNDINQRVIRRQLERLGFAVRIEGDGRAAVAAFEEERFALVLMDIQLPELDGLQATRAMRAREQGHRTPIVALTAHALGGERERCLAAGMDDYLTKPVTQEVLGAMLSRWIAGEAYSESSADSSLSVESVRPAS
jgi:signal transduction histidine kinase/ActR/RegA family two-component response regulator